MTVAIKSVFSCDVRSLALFRIGLGAVLIIDLLSRLRDFRAHYTYWGVVPEPTDPEIFLNAWAHSFMGSAWFMAGVFGVAGLLALLLIVGFQTRVVTVACWFLLLFIQTRNGLTIQGGDNLLLLLFFWGIFLPLGANYSFDAALAWMSSEKSPALFFSTGTVAILLQVACLYFFSALFKHSPEWIPDGTALYYALQMEAFVLPSGRWLLNFPSILQWMTYFTWILEFIGPFLLFVPWLFVPLRLSMVVLFLLLHLGILVFMKVGLFPFVNFVSLIPFIPTWCWERLQSFMQDPDRQGITIFYDGDCRFCRKMCSLLKTFLVLSGIKILPAQQYSEICERMEREETWVVQNVHGDQHVRWEAVLLLVRHSPIFWPFERVLRLSPIRRMGNFLYSKIAVNRQGLSRLTQRLLPDRSLELHPPPVIGWGVGFLAFYMVFINVMSLPQVSARVADPISFVKNTFQLDQKWDMYAPHPRKYDGWVVMPGKLIDGTQVEVFQHRMTAPVLDESNFKENPYPTYRWRKYLQRLALEEYADHRKYLGAYLCRSWNEKHHPLQHLLFFQIYFFQVNTPPPGIPKPPPQRLRIWEQSCL